MLQRHMPRYIRLTAWLCSLAFVGAIVPPVPPHTYAVPVMGPRYDQLSDSTAGVIATHLVGLTLKDGVTPLGSIQIEFCSNDPIPATPCTAPGGLDLTAAVFVSQTGNTGFTIHPSSTVNKIVLSRVPVLPALAASEYQFDNIQNPTSGGTYYIRLRTFATDDASGPHTEDGGIAFSIQSAGLSLITQVPPYLKLCASVSFAAFDCSTATTFLIDLGELSSTNPKTATSELIAATNAGSGFTISVTGATMMSGSNVIPALSSNTGSVPGTGQFGINLRANTSPSIGNDPVGPGVANPTANYSVLNQFRFVDSEAVVTTTGTTDDRKFTVSFLVNVPPGQAPGFYASTLTFIALANF